MIRIAGLNTPSWRQGFARSQALATNPGLWKGLEGLWPIGLGPTGSTLRDIFGSNHGAFGTAKDPATDWVTTSQRGLSWAIKFTKDAVETDRDDHIAITRITVTAAEGNSWGFWFKGTDTAQYPLSRLGHPSSYVNVLSTSYIRWRDRAGTIYPWDPSPNVLNDEWHFVCGTQDAAFTRLYVDGAEVTPAVATVGGSYSWWEAIGEHATGQMSNVAIWRRVLTPNEVWTLYRDPAALVLRRRLVYLGAGGITVYSPDQEGVETSLPLSRAHAVLPPSLPHAVLPEGRAYSVIRDDD